MRVHVLVILWVIFMPGFACAESGFSDALARSYDSNPRLFAARKQYEATTEELAKAMAGMYPTLTATYQRGRQGTKFGTFDETQTTDYRALNLEQPLFRGGQTYYAVKAARRVIEAEQAALMQVESDLLLDTATAYVDVIQAVYVRDLSQKNLDLLRENRRLTEKKFSLGEVTRTDAEQSQARLLQAEVQLQRAGGQLADAQSAYARLTGAPAPINLRPPETIPDVPQMLEQAIAEARAHQFALNAARARHQAAEYNVETAFGRLLPNVALVGSLQREEGSGSATIVGSAFESDLIGIRVNIPLYQSGAEYAQVRQNKSLREQRRYDVRDGEQRLEQDVRRVWQQWMVARASLVADKAGAASAQRALDGVKQEQAMGERSVLDVLNAEQESFQLQMNITRDGRDAIVARLQLLNLTGRLTAAQLQLPVTLYDMKEPASRAAFHPIGL